MKITIYYKMLCIRIQKNKYFSNNLRMFSLALHVCIGLLLSLTMHKNIPCNKSSMIAFYQSCCFTFFAHSLFSPYQLCFLFLPPAGKRLYMEYGIICDGTVFPSRIITSFRQLLNRSTTRHHTTHGEENL